MNTKKWTTKEGKKIRIKDIEDKHLLNVICFLRRKAEFIHSGELLACMSINFQGEQAQYEQDRFISNSSWEDYIPEIYEDMIKEAKKRKLL